MGAQWKAKHKDIAANAKGRVFGKPTEKIKRSLLALTLVFVASSPLSAMAAEQAAALKFGWHDGLAAEVTYTKTKRRDQFPPLSLTSRYKLAVKKHAKGFLVEPSDLRLGENSGAGLESLSPEARMKLQAELGAMSPSIVVAPTGEFIEVVDVEGLRSKLMSLIRQGRAADNNADSALLDQLTSPALLTSAAEGDWNYIVGTWLSDDGSISLEVGKTYGYSYDAPVLFAPSQSIPTKVEVKLIGYKSCERGTQRSCVEIEMTTAPDEASMATLIEQVSQKAGGQSNEALKSMKSLVSFRILTEPGTLIPHSHTTKKDVTVVTTNGGVEKTSSSEESVTTIYSYPK